MTRNSAPGILPFDVVVKAFVSSRMTPTLTTEEFKAVFRSIEAYHSEALDLINWRAILSAPVKRETVSYLGIFPIVVSLQFFGLNLIFDLKLTLGIIICALRKRSSRL